MFRTLSIEPLPSNHMSHHRPIKKAFAFMDTGQGPGRYTSMIVDPCRGHILKQEIYAYPNKTAPYRMAKSEAENTKDGLTSPDNGLLALWTLLCLRSLYCFLCNKLDCWDESFDQGFWHLPKKWHNTNHSVFVFHVIDAIIKLMWNYNNMWT